MAYLENKTLFFTTSPRSPAKMLPEIELLCNNFSDLKWNRKVQFDYTEALAESDFFHGKGSSGNKDFSARDRITRAPKALGFVELEPKIKLTDAGHELLYSPHPNEVFLRQLIKFQIPSPYHLERDHTKGTFYIRPYLEIMRLINELNYLTFDEMKIFGVGLTDYRKFDTTKDRIIMFRKEKKNYQGKYKTLVMEHWNKETARIYASNLKTGDTKTRESDDDSPENFLDTKRSNSRDYADACFRYLRYTGLFTISQHGRTISIAKEKLPEIEFILNTVERKPIFITDIAAYKEYLFDAKAPEIYTDRKEQLIDLIVLNSEYRSDELASQSLDALKSIRDSILSKKREEILYKQIQTLKSYGDYNDIEETYRSIISKEVLDRDLIFEWNTWRAMTMLNGGDVQGNFTLDDFGMPLSNAPGNTPDIECDYGDYALCVEVTLQSGQRQYEAEGEPVARHYGQIRKKYGKNTYCLFIAQRLNMASVAHFYGLNQIKIELYGGKSKIIPMDLETFMQLIDNSYNYSSHPSPFQLKELFDSMIDCIENCDSETEWLKTISELARNWLR